MSPGMCDQDLWDVGMEPSWARQVPAGPRPGLSMLLRVMLALQEPLP